MRGVGCAERCGDETPHEKGDTVNSQWDTQRVARTGLIIAVVLASVWMLWHFLPSLAWAVVLAIATWPLREALARRGIGRTWVAAILTLVLAVVVVLPLITLGIEAAQDGGALVQWVREVHQHGLATPEWLSTLPYVGPTAANWWQDEPADTGGDRRAPRPRRFRRNPEHSRARSGSRWQAA